MMQVCKSIRKIFLSPNYISTSVPAAGVKSFLPPYKYDEIDMPSHPRLKVVQKVPQYSGNMFPHKTQKRLRLMRGPELQHNTLLHRQYGIIALGGGRMKYKNFEMIRMAILRHVDYNKVFAIWRIPEPWQPVTKKPQGTQMGSGKGPINHYVTPVKAEQVIIEVAGKVEYFEVKYILNNIAKRLPFAAMAVSQEIMDRRAEEKRKLKEENLNPYTWKYIIQNNMLGSHAWISKYDRRWFNEYI